MHLTSLKEQSNNYKYWYFFFQNKNNLFFFQENPLFPPEVCHSFVCDAQKEPFPEEIKDNSCDCALLIFVLSTIDPAFMPEILRKIFKVFFFCFFFNYYYSIILLTISFFKLKGITTWWYPFVPRLCRWGWKTSQARNWKISKEVGWIILFETWWDKSVLLQTRFAFNFLFLFIILMIEFLAHLVESVGFNVKEIKPDFNTIVNRKVFIINK